MTGNTALNAIADQLEHVAHSHAHELVRIYTADECTSTARAFDQLREAARARAERCPFGTRANKVAWMECAKFGALSIGYTLAASVKDGRELSADQLSYLENSLHWYTNCHDTFLADTSSPA